MLGSTQDTKSKTSSAAAHMESVLSHTSLQHLPSPPPTTRCQVWESKCVVGGDLVRRDAEVSHIFGGDFCKQTGSARQILSNVTRRSTAVGAGKHLTPHRRRLWELNPRLLQLQSVYWPSSKKKKQKTSHNWQPDSSAAEKRKWEVMIKTSIISSHLGILYVSACVSVCGWKRDVLTPLPRRCESAACWQGMLRWVTRSALHAGSSAELQK